MNDGTILAIAGFALTITGGLIGFFLQRWHIRYRIERDIKVRAGVDFYMAFDTEIGFLATDIDAHTWNPTHKASAYYIIKEATIKHDKAIRVFRRHLKSKHHFAFDKAWKEYRCIEEKEAVEDPFLCYHSDSGNAIEEESKRKLAIDNIESLIGFVNKL